MVNCRLPHSPLQWSVIPFAIAGFVATALPIAVPTPAQAQRNDYQRCAEGLLGAGVAAEDAAYACATALHPPEVSTCFTKVLEDVTFAESELLFACRRVRRPLELATCVVDIHRDRLSEASLSVLDHCRRSLLPVRYSECVNGLIWANAAELENSLSECIAGGYRPRDISPTFIPRD